MSVRYTCYSFHATGERDWGYPSLGTSRKEDVPQTLRTAKGGERQCYKRLYWVWYFIFQPETTWIWLLGVSLGF